MEKKVEVTLELGTLKRKAQVAAKERGLTLEEFITNTIEAKVSDAEQIRSYGKGKDYTSHGGKHMMGKSTGYEVTKDGKYYPASCWTDQFANLFAERAAIYNLVNTIVRDSQERLINVEKTIDNAKNRLIAELGLDPAKPWVYYGGPDGYLQERKAEVADNE